MPRAKRFDGRFLDGRAGGPNDGQFGHSPPRHRGGLLPQRPYVNKDVTGATNTFLMVRTTVGDRGLGVCSPGEYGVGTGTACALPGAYPGGGGDTNELDNAGKAELIRLKIDDGWDWQTV